MTTEVNDVKVKSHKVKEDKFKGDADKYSGAVFLIIIGTIFLLNTTGALSWSVWLLLLRFWPVFIIIAGIPVSYTHLDMYKRQDLYESITY